MQNFTTLRLLLREYIPEVQVLIIRNSNFNNKKYVVGSQSIWTRMFNANYAKSELKQGPTLIYNEQSSKCLIYILQKKIQLFFSK